MREHLPPQFLGDTQPLDGTETRDALTPIGVLARARRIPVPVRQFANRAGNHDGIVARPGGDRMQPMVASIPGLLLAVVALPTRVPRRRADASQYVPALEQATTVIDGFESPLGMELLATVDWLLVHSAVERSVSAITAALREWPGGKTAAARKLKLFDDRLLGLALGRLA